MATSDADLLTEVNAAISEILGGRVAEWKEDRHGVRTLPLTTLMDMRTRLENQIEQANGQVFFPVREGLGL